MTEFKSSNLISTSEGGGSISDGWRVSGYLTRWGEIDSYNDITVKGAFSRAIAENKSGLPFLWSHDYKALPLGTVRAMREDEFGVHFIAEIARTSQAEDIKKLVTGGHLKGISYGYDTRKFDHVNIGQKRVRRLLDVDLQEVSITTFPALKTARILDVSEKNRLIIAEYDTSKAAKLPISRRLTMDYIKAMQGENRDFRRLAEIEDDLKSLKKLI